MKKILLTTLNAKYVHTSLGLWYIFQFCKADYPELVFKEYNINQDLSWVCGEIFLEKAEVVAFSTNIWNIEQTLIICRRLKLILPEITVVLGGPEVGSNPTEILNNTPSVDFIIVGEGELTFKEWLHQYQKNEPNWGIINGLVYRSDGKIIQNESRSDIRDLSILPTPYPEDLSEFRHKLVYYETTRGCPYQCQYCLSANERGIRYFPIERVKRDLLQFIENEIAQVKFVDRSFNANLKWAKDLWQFILDHPGKTNFHFEIVGDLLDEESIVILEKAPPGIIQFEIGVQTTNRESLRLIKRKMNFNCLSHQVRQLIDRTHVFVHLDLIAGLPGEDYLSFVKTFNDNMAIRPHRLQLGFLKLLKGSGIRARVDEYGYQYTAETPYEIIANPWITYPEILKLKVIEDILERYYNSGRFQLSFKYLISQFDSAFDLFEQFGEWWKQQGYDRISHKGRDLYRYLLHFYEESGFNGDILKEILKYDFLYQERVIELPEWAGDNQSGLREFGYNFWKNSENVLQYMGDCQGLAIRDIQRKVLFASFQINPEKMVNDLSGPEAVEPVIILFKYDQTGTKTYTIDPKEVAI